MNAARCAPNCAGCRDLSDPPGAWLNDTFGPSSRDTVWSNRRKAKASTGNDEQERDLKAAS